MIINRIYYILCLTLLISLIFINPSMAKLNIVTGTTNMQSITEAIVKDKANVQSILKGYQNPHNLVVRPGHLMALKSANIFISAGLDMEPWIDNLIDSSGNMHIKNNTKGYIDASKGIHVLEIPASADRSLGDLHSSGNPHYALDPLNVRIITKNIVDGIILKDPSNEAFYKQNRLEFINKVDVGLFGNKLVSKNGGALLYKLTRQGKLFSYLNSTNQLGDLGGWLGKMKSIKNLKVITYHKSWEYFAKRFNLNIIEYIEPKPGIPPSGKHIQQTIEKAKQQNVKYIILEPYYDVKVPQIIAKETKARILILPTEVNGVKNTPNYLSIFDNIVNQFTN